jgi:NAD(P)-dependent dehydrogenase (short-subunit alcohol dehydrogenase family)
MPLQNKIIAVTGANGNLGRAIVHAALGQGASIVMLDISFAEDLNSLPADRVARYELNMFDEVATRACFQQMGPLDALCNAAGGFAMGTAVHETGDADWSGMFDLNVRTLLNGVRGAVPGMQERGSGRIINIGAAAAIKGEALMAPYLVAKSAVLRITESMSAELKDQGINVNCVMPSVIDTPQNRAAMPDADYSEWVSPEQLAEVICFLASDAASGVHGACLPVRNLA